MALLKLRRFIFFIAIIGCVSLLIACHKEKKSASQEQTMVATLQTPVQHLYYSSTVAPISTMPVVTPVAGNIQKLLFTYGEKLKKGQALLVMNSQPLSEDYRKAVSDFLQKKQAFATDKLSFEGTKMLYKANVIPENQYTSEEAQFNNSALSYSESRYQLEKVLHTANIDPKTIEVLSISDTQKVNTILQKHFRNIVVTAPIEGIALYPTTGSNASDSSDKPLTVGASIKENQLLLSIGDLTGLSAQFKVSEVDIDRIVKNMQVKVTSSAFPDIVLQGYVSSVSSQAMQSTEGSGLSLFSVSVEIPKLTEEAIKKIKVGMTAKFEIDIEMKKAVMLPINAVYQKAGQSMVTIMDKNGVKQEVPVVTGETTPTSVVIKSGVKPGDRVVIHD